MILRLIKRKSHFPPVSSQRVENDSKACDRLSVEGKKKKRILSFALASALLLLCAVAQVSVTGQACLGADHNTLIEELSNVCKAGDTIATKYPAYFCDFHYAVAFNTSNSAICIYRGDVAQERVKAPPKVKEQKNEENDRKFTGLSGKVF